jgi:hypothetical protein
MPLMRAPSKSFEKYTPSSLNGNTPLAWRSVGRLLVSTAARIGGWPWYCWAQAPPANASASNNAENFFMSAH